MPNFDELFTAILLFGAVIGAAVFAFLFWVVPWVWQLVKPWLHVVTG